MFGGTLFPTINLFLFLASLTPAVFQPCHKSTNHCAHAGGDAHTDGDLLVCSQATPSTIAAAAAHVGSQGERGSTNADVSLSLGLLCGRGRY